jgi:hypothetical protein
MRPINRTLRLRVAPVLTLLWIAATLGAQTADWKPFAYPADGFRALFPVAPEESNNSVPVGGSAFELHSYVAEVGNAVLYVGVCDYGAKGKAADPDDVLNGARKGVVENVGAHILTESKITLNDSHGLAVEAESDKLHLSIRIYMAGSVLYQTMVTAPLTEKFADTARFLDSFQLTPRPAGKASASAAPAPDWKPYRYAADGFSASFPGEPEQDKQNVSTAAGTFELHTYATQDAAVTLIAAVCNYGAAAAGKDPGAVLDGAKNGAINNVKAHLISEKKITLGANPGVEFEAESDTAHISARLYLVGSTLYQTLVALPLNARYADTGRFLNSFQLAPRAGN